MSRQSGAMGLIGDEFPWELLSVMLNTLLASGTPDRLQDSRFPLPEKDDVRPFPEDFAMRGLLWAANYYPDGWFTNEKIDEEEKYHERASMTAQRKERILWLAHKVAAAGSWLSYDGERFSAPPPQPAETETEINQIESRSSTFASATTIGSLSRAATWKSIDDDQSDVEDPALPTAPKAEIPTSD